MFRFAMGRILAAALGAVGAPSVAAPHERPAVPEWSVPSDAAIRSVLVNLVDRRRAALGIVIGVIEPTGRRVIAYGRRDADDPRPVDGDTLFEIGSITKLFTTLVLSDMVRKGEVKLDDPASPLLPPAMALPVRAGRQITLLDLATHTSGLPNFPYNLAPRNPLNPFADYNDTELASFLSSYRLPRAPGSYWVYSSLGVGLLGNALAWREHASYETLIRKRVLDPLGLKSTGITLTPDQLRRLSPGHTAWLSAAPNWDLPTLAGAAALRSSANDMLTFLAANLGYAQTPLNGAMGAMLATRRPTDWRYDAQAIGWVVSQTYMGEVVQHEGKTSGYRSYIAFDPLRRTGIVVLANAATEIDLGNVGDRLLIGTIRS